MMTIAIPQLYCGASGHKGTYNRQEMGLARALAALGHRAVVLYPDPAASTAQREEPESGVVVYTCPARALGVSALYKSWQPLLDEGVNAVHCMGDNALGVPGLYRFCRRHRIFFYSQLGALRSASPNPRLRRLMDALNTRNLSIYRKTPTYAKTPAVEQEMRQMGVSCAGVLPVGLDVSVIPDITESREELRRNLNLPEQAKLLLFVGRLDSYKHPLDLVPVLQALPQSWQLVVIGDGRLAGMLDEHIAEAGLTGRIHRIPVVPNAEVHQYCRACDVFVNLNPEEIFGMSLLEAMYDGCPPAARHAPGPDLIIEDGVSGILADTPEELAAAVQRAENTPEMKQAAQQRIRQKFLWESSAQTVLAMLESEGGFGG